MPVHKEHPKNANMPMHRMPDGTMMPGAKHGGGNKRAGPPKKGKR